MFSKIIAKLEALAPIKKLLLIAGIVTIILSCGIIIFVISTQSDSPVASSASTDENSSTTESPSDLTNTSNNFNNSSTSPNSTPDSSSSNQRPELVDTPLEDQASNNQNSSSASTSNSSSSYRPTTSPATPQAPAKTPEEIDPICGGKNATSARCIVYKMYGTQSPKNHPFAYDVANHYSTMFQRPGYTSDTIHLSGDSEGALAMVSKDLRLDETDKVSIEFYAYDSHNGWNVDWKATVFRKTGDKTYVAYLQAARSRIPLAERQAITDRYIPNYTKEFRETQALYERNYLTWYNSTK